MQNWNGCCKGNGKEFNLDGDQIQCDAEERSPPAWTNLIDWITIQKT